MKIYKVRAAYYPFTLFQALPPSRTLLQGKAAFISKLAICLLPIEILEQSLTLH